MATSDRDRGHTMPPVHGVEEETGTVTGILTTLVLAKVFLRISRFNYERIEVLYTP